MFSIRQLSLVVLMMALTACTTSKTEAPVNAPKAGNESAAEGTCSDGEGVGAAVDEVKDPAGPMGEVDVAQIRPYTHQLELQSPTPFPFVARYSQGQKELYFLATNHEHYIHSATFQLLDDVLKKSKVQVMVLQGIESSLGDNPASMIQNAVNVGQGEFFLDGERQYAIDRAVKGKMKFVGGEPDEQHLSNELIKKGYALTDLLSFYFVRQITEYQRNGLIDDVPVETLYQRFMVAQSKKNKIPESSLLTYEKFLSWYEQGNQQKFLIKNINSETAAPESEGQLLTQKIAAIIGRERDLHIVNVIAEMLNRYDKVFVIYGGSHFLTQQLALEKMMGVPVEVMMPDLSKVKAPGKKQLMPDGPDEPVYRRSKRHRRSKSRRVKISKSHSQSESHSKSKGKSKRKHRKH
jgi:hypothetical protein